MTYEKGFPEIRNGSPRGKSWLKRSWSGARDTNTLEEKEFGSTL